MTAAFTGYYMNRSDKLTHIDLRVLFLQGLVTALFAGGILLHSYGVGFLTPNGKCPAMTAYAIYVVCTTMLMGAALSYILQKWITTNRQKRHESNGSEEPDSGVFQDDVEAGSPSQS